MPARFFVTAPVFGVLSALTVVGIGPVDLADRWTPAALAVTHLLTLGYMGMVMLGALMQVFPVVIGHPFKRAPMVSAVVHASLTPGTLLLAAGFLLQSQWLMIAALVLLGFALLTFLAAAMVTLISVEAWGDTSRAIALALTALAVTAGFGVWLASGHAGLSALPRQWTGTHALWGLAGWVPLLLMAVAFQVVPMFQVTPEYPRFVRRGFPAALFAVLVADTTANGLGFADQSGWLFQGIGGFLLAGFAASTLVLQHRRRRSRPDVTIAYWRTGLACLLVAVCLWVTRQLPAAAGINDRFDLILGVLLLPGFSVSVINGMLYKIVPFLVWLHLAMAPADPERRPVGRAPGMKRIIPEQRSRRQWRTHLLGLALLGAGALGLPGALLTGALVMALAFVLLGLDILAAIRLYHTTVGEAEQATTPLGDSP